MTPNKYNVFLEVARKQNISKAADALGYTQSGVSHTIKRMEKDLGLALFDRNRNGAFLTTAGKELLPYISQMVQCRENLTQAIESLHNLHQGSLTIGTYSSIARQWLPHIIQRFQKDYPEVRINFKEGGNEDIIHWISHGELDLGFLSACFDENLEWIPLKEDPLMAVLPEDYSPDYSSDDSSKEKKVFPLKEFNGKTFIISTLGTDVDVHDTLEKNHIKPDIRYSANDDFTIVSMVACHLGLSILPGLVLKSYEAPVLTLPLEPYATRELGIALPSKSMASPATLKFIEYTKEYIQSAPI